MQNNNSLAKISLAINALLVIAVIILFTKGSGNGSGEESSNDTTQTSQVMPNDSELKIGYFLTDSLNSKLLMIKDLEADMAAAQADAENKMKGKQGEIDNWKKKWEKRMPLLSSEEQQYGQEMQKMQMDAMEFEQRIQMELGQKQEMIMFSHIQRISNFSKIYAEQNGFDMIMSYQLGQNPIYIHPSMDVTNGLVKLMNDDYNSTFQDNGTESTDVTAEN